MPTTAQAYLPRTAAQGIATFSTRALHRGGADAVQEFLAGVTSFLVSYPETATKLS
jgi:hypothetical protein